MVVQEASFLAVYKNIKETQGSMGNTSIQRGECEISCRLVDLDIRGILGTEVWSACVAFLLQYLCYGLEACLQLFNRGMVNGSDLRFAP